MTVRANSKVANQKSEVVRLLNGLFLPQKTIGPLARALGVSKKDAAFFLEELSEIWSEKLTAEQFRKFLYERLDSDFADHLRRYFDI